MNTCLKIATTLLFYFCMGFSHSQSAYQFNINKAAASCVKGAAVLVISGRDPSDTVKISWSSGQTDVTVVDGLAAGDHFVTINILHKIDTTITFTIDTEPCKVFIPQFFSPNGDEYNDFLEITGAEYYPNFEFEIFNKWGQRVHSQRSKYTHWDATSGGINVPDGTYYYVFFYDASNKKNLMKGSFTILR